VPTIQRQSLQHALVNFAGLGVGAASTLWVYPNVLEGHGLFQILLSVGIVGLPVLTLGANTMAVRFFPRFDDSASGHRGFLGLLLLHCGVGCLLSGLLAGLAWPWVGPLLHTRSPLLWQYLWAAAPLAFLFVTSTILSVYSANFKRITVPTLLLDFSQKIAIPLLLIGVWQHWFTLDQAIWGLLAHASAVCVGMVWYLRRLGQWHFRWPDWAFFDPAFRGEVYRFVGFGTFGGFAILLASKADIFVVGALRPVSDASIYAMSAFFAATLDIPTKSLYAASASSVARYLADDDRLTLLRLYRKVSINLLCAGVLIFGAIWVSIDDLYRLMDNSAVVSAGKWVFFFIGLSKLVEMGTGLNNYLIYYSRYYTWSLLSLGLMAIANVLGGLWLIPRVGLEGAAIATLLSMTFYNAFSLWLVWRKFGLQPFVPATLVVLLVGLGAWALLAWLPRWDWPPLLHMAFRSGLYGLLVLSAYWRFRVSSDFNMLAERFLRRFF
jgi:O-antigen/teichoic acid export membrane protein